MNFSLMLCSCAPLKTAWVNRTWRECLNRMSISIVVRTGSRLSLLFICSMLSVSDWWRKHLDVAFLGTLSCLDGQKMDYDDRLKAGFQVWCWLCISSLFQSSCVHRHARHDNCCICLLIFRLNLALSMLRNRSGQSTQIPVIINIQ